MDMNLSKHRELVIDREAWGDAAHGVSKSRTWLSDWTELIWSGVCLLSSPWRQDLDQVEGGLAETMCSVIAELS